jgi:FkbM family methyltransferase
MPRARQWMGELLLHAPQPLRSLRNLPLLGGWIHRVSHRVLPLQEKVWARVEAGPAQGLWLELNPRTGQNYLRGDAELPVQKILAERLRPGMVFYDLGANIGLFTLLAARLVGDSGKVFSFEPDPENAARLRRNIQRNRFANVTVVEKGIWSASTKLNFLKSGADSPDHGIGKFSTTENGAGGTLTECVSLDDFTRDAGATPPDALKCDVEGAEVEALCGGAKLFQSRHPWIVCEMHSDANRRAAIELLENFGYAVRALDGDHVLAMAGDGPPSDLRAEAMGKDPE